MYWNCVTRIFILQYLVLISTITTNAAFTGPISNAGVDLIKQFEGFRGNFYYDAAGIRTIGYGHACHVGDKCAGIRAPITRETATIILQKDLKKFESCINANVKYAGLNEAQFSALVSFVFNLGCGSLRQSTLLKYLNTGNTSATSKEFAKWIRGGGKVLPGLVRRREAERVLFCSQGGC